MPAPPKGKAPTKGAKQILFENTATVIFTAICHWDQHLFMDYLHSFVIMTPSPLESLHIKDIVILSSITHVLAAVSNYFWLLLLLLPLRAFWLIWTNILGPWFFQEAPQETEQDEKKKKKIERKMKRFQQ